MAKTSPGVTGLPLLSRSRTYLVLLGVQLGSLPRQQSASRCCLCRVLLGSSRRDCNFHYPPHCDVLFFSSDSDHYCGRCSVWFRRTVYPSPINSLLTRLRSRDGVFASTDLLFWLRTRWICPLVFVLCTCVIAFANNTESPNG